MRTETYYDAPALNAALCDIRSDISSVPPAATASRTTYSRAHWYDYGSASRFFIGQVGMTAGLDEHVFCRNAYRLAGAFGEPFL